MTFPLLLYKCMHAKEKGDIEDTHYRFNRKKDRVEYKEANVFDSNAFSI